MLLPRSSTRTFFRRAWVARSMYGAMITSKDHLTRPGDLHLDRSKWPQPPADPEIDRDCSGDQAEIGADTGQQTGTSRNSHHRGSPRRDRTRKTTTTPPCAVPKEAPRTGPPFLRCGPGLRPAAFT